MRTGRLATLGRTLRLPLAGGWNVGWIHQLSEVIEAERERWILWLPVGFGMGIALYFALPTEPSPFVVPLVLPPLIFGAFLTWRQARAIGRSGPAALLAIFTVLMLLGLAAAQWRTHRIEAPTLERRGAYQIEGEVSPGRSQGQRRPPRPRRPLDRRPSFRGHTRQGTVQSAEGRTAAGAGRSHPHTRHC